jgi:hypothetical protein
MSMAEAFLAFAKIDLEAHDEAESLADAARSRGLMVPDGASWEDVYNQAFVNWVEPALPQDRPLVLSGIRPGWNAWLPTFQEHHGKTDGNCMPWAWSLPTVIQSVLILLLSSDR